MARNPIDVEIHEDCLCCGAPTVTLHTDADQSEAEPGGWWASEDDRVTCAECGAEMLIRVNESAGDENCDGVAYLWWDEDDPANIALMEKQDREAGL